MADGESVQRPERCGTASKPPGLRWYRAWGRWWPISSELAQDAGIPPEELLDSPGEDEPWVRPLLCGEAARAQEEHFTVGGGAGLIETIRSVVDAGAMSRAEVRVEMTGAARRSGAGVIYDWRSSTPPGGVDFYDERTGEPVGHVFYYETATGRLGRYGVEADGRIATERRGWRVMPVEIYEVRRLRVGADVPVVVEGKS